MSFRPLARKEEEKFEIPEAIEHWGIIRLGGQEKGRS